MKLYPLFANLRDRAVIIVGGGEVAARKCRALLDTGARVTVVAPSLHADFFPWTEAGRAKYVAGNFADSQLDEAWLVIAATDDLAINRRIADAANSRRVFVNVVDDAELSTFHVPAVVDRAPLQIAISSGGAAPMLARRLREHLETLLDHALGPLATLLDRARRKIRLRFGNTAARRAFYEDIFAGSVMRLVRAGRLHEPIRKCRWPTCTRSSSSCTSASRACGSARR